MGLMPLYKIANIGTCIVCIVVYFFYVLYCKVSYCMYCIVGYCIVCIVL